MAVRVLFMYLSWYTRTVPVISIKQYQQTYDILYYKQTIQLIKNDKSPGNYDIQEMLIKYAVIDFQEEHHHLGQKIWNNEGFFIA